MANVFFKRGLQANLPATGSNGAFYLTTDTNRLYVCNSDNGPLVELNQSINTVAKMSDLPTGTSEKAKGQYYYITELNALAYFDGTDWVQINPDTKLVDKEQDTAVTVASNIATVTHVIEDTFDTEKGGPNQSVGTVKVSGSGLVKITPIDDGFDIDVDVDYDLGVAAITDGAKVSLTGDGDTDDYVNFKGEGATTVTVNGKDVIISSTDENTTYSMELEEIDGANDGVNVKLMADGAVEADKFGIVSGTNITVEQDGENIKISAAGAANMYNEDVSLAFDENGKLTVGVKDGASDKPLTADVTPTIKYGKTEQPVTFADGTADLNVYTIDEVDELLEEVEKDFAQQLQVADALHYCGTVSQADKATKLNITKAHNGDTYKASEIIYVDPEADPKIMFANKGDLIIADGTEDEETGFLTSGTWEVISSGDDQVIIGDITENTYKVKDGTEVLAELELKTFGENLKDIEWVTSGSKLTGTIKHDGPGVADGSRTTAETAAAQNPTESLTFTVVSGLTYDANGHVIGAQTRDITVVDTDTTIPDTHNHLEAVVVSTTQSGTAVSVDTKVDMEDEDKHDAFAIDSSSLKLVAGEKKVSIDLEWGSF